MGGYKIKAVRTARRAEGEGRVHIFITKLMEEEEEEEGEEGPCDLLACVVWTLEKLHANFATGTALRVFQLGKKRNAATSAANFLRTFGGM